MSIENIYVAKGFMPDAIILSDGTRLTDPEDIKRQMALDEAEAQKAVEAKGHDCWDYPVHSTFERTGGGRQDAYHCGKCGDLLQVG